MTQGGQALIHWLALRRLGAARAPAERESAAQKHAWTAEALHQRYLGDVFAYVARRVPDHQEAEDVTAEVFAAAFVALPQQNGPNGPYPWLLGIARIERIEVARPLLVPTLRRLGLSIEQLNAMQLAAFEWSNSVASGA